MIRFILLLIALVMFALLGLNVMLTIGIITRHPFEWLGGAFAFLTLSYFPFPDYDRRGRRVVQEP